MKTINDPIFISECLYAIGNSLELHDMLSEVITTFLRCSGALGGKYFENTSNSKLIVSIGNDFTGIDTIKNITEPFSIQNTDEGAILRLTVADGYFLFIYDRNSYLESIGTIFSTFTDKLSNAINGCRNFEKLRNMNLNLTHQINIEKNKNIETEKLMISQSRMAIMGEMIGMIAHQWRQPITIIGLLTNKNILDIQTGEFNKNQLINDLESIDRQVHFLSQTIDDFRNFSRPNKLPQTITYNEIENELITIIGKNYDSHEITLIFEGKKTLQLTTYKNELYQVFLNILNNSKDAFVGNNIKNGVVRVQLNEHLDSLHFLITDNAGGIQPDLLKKIFKLHFSTKNEKDGTGLGLYMSAIIVEKHLEGSICACSEGDSSTFSIILPKIIDHKGYHVY